MRIDNDKVLNWVEWSRDHLCSKEILPLVISPQSCPWSESLKEILADDSPEPLSQMLMNVLADKPNDLCARFTVLKILRDMYWFLLDSAVSEGQPFDVHDSWSGLDERLKLFVRLVDSKDCTEWRRIRWEISNAYLVEDWELAETLFLRARELNRLLEAEWYTLHGQFLFYSIFNESVTNLFYAYEEMYPDIPATRPDLLQYFVDLDVHPLCDAHMKAVLKHMMVSWDEKPPMGMTLSMFYCIFPAERSLDLELSTEVPNEDDPLKELNESRRQRVEKTRSQLLQCVADLTIAVERAPDLAPVYYRLMIARCWFELSTYDKAAEYYERSLDLMDDSEPSLPVYWTYRAIADCHLKRNATDKALNWLQKASEKYPERPDIFHKIAELQARQGAYHDAYENLRRAKDLDPSVGEDWRTSTILALGEVSDSHLVHDKWIDKFRSAHPGVVQMAAGVMAHFWPTFKNLSQKAQTSFVDGLIMKIIEDQPLPPENRKVLAAFRFGQSVEFELKAKVFKEFSDDVQRGNELQGLLGLEATSPAGGKLRAFLQNRRTTFGDLLSILSGCQHTNDELLRKLCRFVRDRFPSLLPKLGTMSRLNEFVRNPAVHDGETTIDVGEIQRLTRQCLEAFRQQPALRRN